MTIPTREQPCLLSRLDKQQRIDEILSNPVETFEKVRKLEATIAEQAAEIERVRNSDDHNFERWQREQDRVKALTDALEGLLHLDEEDNQRYPGDEDVCLEVREAREAIANVRGK